VEDIDTHIQELEHRIQHDSLSLNEEKRVLEQIKALKKSRRWAGGRAQHSSGRVTAGCRAATAGWLSLGSWLAHVGQRGSKRYAVPQVRPAHAVPLA
jgi:hypothetical protein